MVPIIESAQSGYMSPEQATALLESPPTRHDIAADCFAATEAAVALTARGRTWLALDTAAEVGLMQQSSLWQSGGASADGFLLWAKARGIPVQFVAKDPERSGSVDVMRLDSDLVKVTFYYDGPVRK